VFSETVIEYAYNPRTIGEISCEEGIGKVTGIYGDTVVYAGP